tara:strand:+ start:381 stop:998 length:618 start_codon:yes stop_codon:yes gene_type:complete
MAYLRFYQDGVPPVLSDGRFDIQVENYIVGSPVDPHWQLYPKSEWPGIRHRSPIGYAFTDYQADSTHYVFYLPENSGPTVVYSRLLKNHFETIHHNLQQPIRETRQAEIATVNAELEERKEKAKQLKSILKEQQSRLKLYKNELIKLKSIRDRSVRGEVRSGMQKEMAENIYDSKFPSYVNTAGSIIVLERNIVSLKNELRYYTD